MQIPGSLHKRVTTGTRFQRLTGKRTKRLTGKRTKSLTGKRSLLLAGILALPFCLALFAQQRCLAGTAEERLTGATQVTFDGTPSEAAREGLIDPTILDAYQYISEDRLTEDARVLTGEAPYQGNFIESRHILHPDHDLAISYLEDRISAMGLEVVEEPFDCPAPDGCVNLVVEQVGSRYPDVIWVVGAHFDSTNGYDPQLPAPGAVDNASGVVVVLETLEALRHYHLRSTVRFILFDAEEEGLIGSQAHAEAAAARGEAIQVLVNLDVPGWRLPDHNSAFSSSDEASWPVLQQLNHIALRYPTGTLHIGVPLPNNDTADMASFWAVGYRGFIMGSLYDLTGWMNTEQDTFDHFDTEQCANVSRIVVAFIGEMAGITGQ